MKLALLMALAVSLAAPANAQMARAEQGLYRIDIAGSLRMRTQRMLRNACYVAAGIQDDSITSALPQDIAEADAIQLRLIEGDEALGLTAERSPVIRHQLEEMIAIRWEQFKLYPLYISASGTASADDLAQMSELADHLVSGFNELVADLEEKYARGSVLPADQTRTLNVMGRQRMLSQRIAAQHCALATGDDPASATAELAQTLSVLNTAFTDLRFGNLDNRIVEPSEETLAALECAHETFLGMSDLIEAGLNGDVPTVEELGQMNVLSNLLLRQSHDALQIANDGFNGREVTLANACQSA
ncbi:type IV pili methyl-accepting chemotaxis transducer N-terminal domain-containing protein [Pontivivens insulae]|uniref:NarX-like N-terminal domain-containing protein n=1 Tax=Pontivivens insulae TaxID=1639689 RepID=A0A2R8A744_9RHOB|nr:type IV pili methyl-accepting chemotaxis transducer N-terminal domain-containing protein [Pontivivens insulae]RED17939.1 PilJ/NarX-like methyl-accepting chemotaxis transducer [Pontivivens insulae]SPF27828.1 hypothetical protein POI8812_00123 [Pontivivens insulae]